MATVHDLAAYILKKQGRMTTMKLQKLLYYCQAWSLVWDERPMFRDRIEAWVNGPVVPNVYRLHRTLFDVKAWPTGNANALSAQQRETADAVLGFYGDKTSQWLIELTHAEQPWRDARRGLAPTERGSNEILPAAMAEYYSGLTRA